MRRFGEHRQDPLSCIRRRLRHYSNRYRYRLSSPSPSQGSPGSPSPSSVFRLPVRDNLRMRIYKMPRKEKTVPPTEAAEREKRIMAAVQEVKSGKSTRQAAKHFLHCKTTAQVI